MGAYYNPPLEVKEVGRLISKGRTIYEKLLENLKEDEVIFCLVEVWTRAANPFSAAFIGDEEENIAGLRGDIQGYYEILGYYAVPRKKAEEVCGPLPQTLPPPPNPEQIMTGY